MHSIQQLNGLHREDIIHPGAVLRVASPHVGRGLHSFTLELNLSNSRTHS